MKIYLLDNVADACIQCMYCLATSSVQEEVNQGVFWLESVNRGDWQSDKSLKFSQSGFILYKWLKKLLVGVTAVEFGLN